MGFQNTSFQMIGKRIGKSHVSIIHHFKNKNNLLKEIINYIFTHVSQMVQSKSSPSDDAYDVLLKNMQANFEWCRDFPKESCLVMLMYYSSTHNDELKAVYKHLLTLSRSKYETIIEQGVREGVFKQQREPKVTAQMVQEIMIGTLVNYMAVPELADEESVWGKWNYFMKELLLIS
jgi:AcrR family transcriptional regulator